MADFDTIYEERDVDEDALDNYTIHVPDPIIIRGAGNVTVFVHLFKGGQIVKDLECLRIISLHFFVLQKCSRTMNDDRERAMALLIQNKTFDTS